MVIPERLVLHGNDRVDQVSRHFIVGQVDTVAAFCEDTVDHIALIIVEGRTLGHKRIDVRSIDLRCIGNDTARIDDAKCDHQQTQQEYRLDKSLDFRRFFPAGWCFFFAPSHSGDSFP